MNELDEKSIRALSLKCASIKLPLHEYVNQVANFSTLFKFSEFLDKYFKESGYLSSITYYDQCIICTVGNQYVNFQVSLDHDSFFNVTEISVLAFDSVEHPSHKNGYIIHVPALKKIESRFLEAVSADDYAEVIKQCLKVNTDDYEPTKVFHKVVKVKSGTMDTKRLQSAVSECAKAVSKLRTKSIDDYITNNLDQLINQCLQYID